jgi:hypothetical protein
MVRVEKWRSERTSIAANLLFIRPILIAVE